MMIGVDVDTCDPQYIHAVTGKKHLDRHPICGALTLWGYFEGKKESVTCPACRRLLGLLPSSPD